MSDYFDQFEQSMGAALERGAHTPWYSRAWRIRHGRAFAAVFGALVIGTPAGAVTNCFGACLPPQAKVSASAGHGAQAPQLADPLAPGASDAPSLRRRLSARRPASSTFTSLLASAASTPTRRLASPRR